VKARNLVGVASQIQTKINKKEIAADSEELKEI
jgi:hypothetical protein